MMIKAWENLLNKKCFKYLLLLLFCLALSCWAMHYDYDLYARLIVGEHFFTKGSIAYKDFLSYTPTHTWYDHEYGASLFFYAFFKVFGPYGLNLINALLIFGTTYFCIKTQKLNNTNLPTLMAPLFLFILIFNSLNSSIVRCHMFSFFFTSLILYMLEKHRLKSSRLIWLIPILIVIWNNIHGGVVTGLGITFIYMICAILQKRDWKTYFYVLAISTPLLIINPYGIEYLSFLFSANTMSRMYVTEWWNVFTFLHVTKIFPIFALCLFIFLLSLRKNELKQNLTRFILLAVTLYLGFTHIKLMPITLIVAFALFYNDFVKLFEKKSIILFEKMAYVFIAIVVFSLPLSQPLTAKSGINKFPITEVEFLKINDIKGNILTNFGLGSYVAYKLYPNNLIFIDGRYEEVYFNEEVLKLKHYELAEENWDDVVKDYPTEILMPTKNIAIYNYLLNNQSDWVQIYEGNVCGVFVKKKNVKKNYKKPSNDIRYYQKTAFDKTWLLH